MITLGVFVIISVPVSIRLITDSVSHLAAHSSLWSVLDASVVLAITISGPMLWARFEPGFGDTEVMPRRLLTAHGTE